MQEIALKTDRKNDTVLRLKKPLTPKQRKFLEILQENADGDEDPKSISQMMIEAGYSPATAKTPSRITSNVPFQQFFSTKITRGLVVSAHKKLLKAKVKVRTYQKGELKTEYITEDTLGLAKGVDLAYRVMGAFAPVETKHTITGLEAKSDDELEQMLMEEQKTLNRSNNFKKNVIEGEVIENK